MNMSTNDRYRSEETGKNLAKPKTKDDETRKKTVVVSSILLVTAF